MTRIYSILAAVSLLAACGGGNVTRFSQAPVLYATGPILSACTAQDRRAASSGRCGCVQAVADMSLSQSDQRRGAGYFSNPGELQEVRQSDRARDERFWLEWKAFGQQAARLCSGT